VRLRPRYVTVLAAVLAGGLTDLVIMVPSLHFAYRSLPLHAMLEAAATLIAFLTVYLLWGRLRQRQRLTDLLLFIALGLLALTNLLFAAIPAIVWTQPHPFSVWTTLSAGGLGAALLAVAALVPARRLRNYEQAAGRAIVAGGACLILAGVIVGGLIERLPVGIDPGLSPSGSWPAVGSTVIVIVQIVIGVLFAAAAVGFTRRSEREGDELLLWLGAGSAVGAFARVNYFIFPSLYSEWVYSGDALRLCFFVMLFVGAAREIGIYQRGFAESRVLDERRRIARDLHDGLAQELAFVASKSRELAAGGSVSPIALRQIASAAQRGLDESRRAIAMLAGSSSEPLDVAVAQAVEDVAHRLGARIEIDAEPTPAVEPRLQEQLLRIAREAVTNAGRHGRAELVRVELSNGNGLRLRIVDDGIGFDPTAFAENGEGFGLVTMRERAHSVGGQLRIVSARNRGTEVEVVIP